MTLEVGGRLAVVLDELDDVNAGRQFDQPLLEPHQQVFDLRCLGSGLLLGDLANGEPLALAVPAEDARVTLPRS